MCKAVHESAQQRVSQSRSGWPITSVSDEKVPPACLYRCAGTRCASMGMAGTLLFITWQLLQEQQHHGQAHVGASGS